MPAAGRAGTNRGLTSPRPRRFSTGAPPPDPGVLFARVKSTQKHASPLWAGPGFFRSQPLQNLAPGAPRPGPGSLFPRRKSDQNAAGETPDPVFQSACIRLCRFAATELKDPSGIRSVPGFSSMLRPLALLKGYMHLFSRIGLPAARGGASAPVNKNLQNFQHEGALPKKTETTLSTRAVRRSRTFAAPVTRWPEAKRYFSGNRVLPCRCPIRQKGGPGSPRRAFAYFSRAGKVGRRRHTPPGRGTPQRKKEIPPARGPSGEVGHSPHRLRGGRRPKGDSVATGYHPRY